MPITNPPNTVVDSNFIVTDATDPTKKLKFDVTSTNTNTTYVIQTAQAGVSGSTITLTLPDTGGAIITDSSTNFVSNKLLDDATSGFFGLNGSRLHVYCNSSGDPNVKSTLYFTPNSGSTTEEAIFLPTAESANGTYTLAAIDVTQTLSKKTVSDGLKFTYMAAPSTPAASTGHVYFKTDGKAYAKNAAGTEYDLTAGGSSISDTAYDATSWDAVTTTAPSKNAVRDQIETMLTSISTKAPLASPTFTGTPSLPTGTTAVTQTAGNNTTAVATTAFVTAADDSILGSYSTLMTACGSHTAAKVAGTYALGQGDPVAVSGTGTLYPLQTIYIAAADYPTINGLAPKLRIRAQLYTNDVAPTGNFTFGLYPITRPATSGGAGLAIYTIGTVISGSNGATFTTPAADGLLQAVGSDFALPADGHYVIAVVTTATIATSAHVHMNATLQIRNA